MLTFDLLLGLLFFVLKTVLKLLKAVAYALSLPFRLARWVSLKLERRVATADHGHDLCIPLKPCLDQLRRGLSVAATDPSAPRWILPPADPMMVE